ncbi:Up in starvation [Lecanora helva]
MTATFEPVNVGLGLSNYPTEATTPTTPRALIPPPIRTAPPPPADDTAQSGPNTPTSRDFAGMNGQRPLPTSPLNNSFSVQTQPLGTTRPGVASRGDSQRSVQSAETQDVDMDESDEGEGDAGSDAESIDAETGRPSKKKKGQRFFCTEFPPCKLSFTRSEHLARHIRKHTGERPFQCHCSRRFSRLDNLRQHAQTVHINEEIPTDSLAATGTRFQRQIRTDRVRPQTGRARAGTAGSQGSHSRGHSRNLSASSIGSTASSMGNDVRRRPPPLIMSNDSPTRSRLTLDTLRSQASTPPGQCSFLVEPSDGASTPTSTTYSNGPNSPGYGSSLGSPASTVSRGGGFWDGRSHNRRLSVPSGPSQFQSPHHNTYPSPYLNPLASSTASTFSNFSSALGSPTSTTYGLSRHDAEAAEIRRRTWHPSTYTYSNYTRPATSGLSYYQTPDAPRPAFAPQAASAASQPHRLPGIETFDQVPHRSTTPPPRGPSPVQIDPAIRPPFYPGPSGQPISGPIDRRGHSSWDMSLHQNLTKLDLANSNQPTESGAWTPQSAGIHSQTSHPVQATTVVPRDSQGRPEETLSYPAPTSNKAKRQGIYIGHVGNPQQRTPREDSSSSEGIPITPSLPPSEQHPAIVNDNGFIDQFHPSNATGIPHQPFVPGNARPPTWPLPDDPMHQQHKGPKDTQMSGLEVLVAVATREENASSTRNS